MKSSRWNRELAIVMALAEILYMVEAVDDVNKFRRCYNVSVETHCFDVQYDTTNTRLLHASFYNARKRCKDQNATLLIIENDEINDVVRQFWNEYNNPIRQQNVWTDAYRVSDFINTFTWHWINSTLPTMKALDFTYPYDFSCYVVSIEFREKKFVLTAKQPYPTQNYICEYVASNCSSSSSDSARLINGRCYVASNDQLSWHEARNRCLKNGGDLASFANVSGINFTSWLRSDSSVRYWIGLQFTWYTWIDTGDTVTYSNWKINDYGWYTTCLVVSYDNSAFGWFPRSDTSDRAYVVCHTVTSINPPTTSTTTFTTTTAITSTSTSTSSEGSQITSNESNEGNVPNNLAIGVGVGVGVGVSILIALIVLSTCIVVRMRRHKTPSSKQSTNHQQKETSVDQPSESPTDNERSEVGDPTYGTVVPSTIARRANGANPTSGNAEYAPLQFQ